MYFKRKGYKLTTHYLSYKDAMNYLGIKSPITLKKYIELGLPTINIGNSKKISVQSIDEFMEAHKVVKTK